MKYRQKLFKTCVWLVISLGVFIYAFVSKAIVINEGGLDLYPSGPNWICIIGFAIIALPAIFEIIKEVCRSIRRNNQYQDAHRTATVRDYGYKQEVVSVDNRGFEKLIGILVALIAGGALIYFFGPFAAAGFTVYRIGVLIYCIFRISTETKKY